MTTNKHNSLVVFVTSAMSFILFSVIGLSEPLANDTDAVDAKIRESVRKLFQDNDTFNKLNQESIFLEISNGESFYNIDRAAIEKLVGEEFEDDKESLAVENSWNFDMANSENWKYAIDDEQERFLLRHRRAIFEDAKKENYISTESVQKIAAGTLAGLGVKTEEDLDIRELRRTLMTEDGQLVEDSAVAYKVFVNRRIGDIPVRDSRIVLTYLLDGTLQKIMMKWPAVENRSVALARSYTDDEIIDRVTQGMKENDMTDFNSLSADVTVDIYEGSLRLGVIISALVPGPDNSSFGKEFFIEI